MMTITPVRWANVEPGSMVLCADGVLREAGKKEPTRGSGDVYRDLGTTGGPGNRGRHFPSPDAMVMVVASATDSPRDPEVPIAFMRTGFTVELLPL